MRIVCISDTHGYHQKLTIPHGDILIHAGDLTVQSNVPEVRDFLAWFATQPHDSKVFIAGNHDRLFENEPEMAASLVPAGITYLQDSGCIVEGLSLWGSPVQPWFLDWAFNRRRGADIARHWDLIPGKTDVLITHGPARGILDQDMQGKHHGCADLRKRLTAIQPRLHICGHIHGGYGSALLGRTRMVNAAICDDEYRPVRVPIVIDL